jgi:hypothetical protein
MNPGPSADALARGAAEVCDRAALPAEVRSLVKSGQTAGQFLAGLVAGADFPHATKFLAAALPKREAVWWACLCVRQSPMAAGAPAEAALRAAERWAADPTDDHRRAAFAAAEAAGVGTAAGCAALAAFLSGGSLAPPTIAEVPPAEHLTASAVAGAVTLAAVAVQPERAAERYKTFFALGTEVGRGARKWPAGQPK